MKTGTPMTHVGEHETGARAMKIEDFVTKLRGLRDVLSDGLVERDVAVRLSLLASLAGEHLLMVGPPGTAKSLIARRLHLAFQDSTYFERLLTRFTVPEELFGPLSIKGLEEDRYERLTDAYLPKASIAFLDEIFKANSAILNALLTLLNEREFDNGSVRDKTPLVAVIGASNEMPEGEELDALFDRFLLRLHVGPVTKQAFPTLLKLRGQSTPRVDDHLKLHEHELQKVQEVSESVDVPDDVLAMLCDLRDWCTSEGISVSDRRWRKIVKLLQVSAVTNGRGTVSIWDCWLLQHCLWDTPAAREKIYDWYAARVGASAAMDPSRLTTIIVAWEAQLSRDQEDKAQMRDEDGRLVFKSLDGKYTTATKATAQARRGTEALYLAPDGACSQHPHFGGETMKDRTNGGSGYTRSQLEVLYVVDANRRWREFKHWEGSDSYLAQPNNWLTEEVKLSPVLEPTRHKDIYIEGCTKQLGDHRANVEEYRRVLVNHIKSLNAEISDHLWVTVDFAEPAAQTLEQTLQEVDTLLARVSKLTAGFAALPREVKPKVSRKNDGQSSIAATLPTQSNRGK
jgi:MoxR-like ATPase